MAIWLDLYRPQIALQPADAPARRHGRRAA
jgi:hypothetical protein